MASPPRAARWLRAATHPCIYVLSGAPLTHACAPQAARGQALRRGRAARAPAVTRQARPQPEPVCGRSSQRRLSLGAPQVPCAIATGPKPPLTFSNSNDEGSPVKVSIGQGMGELPGPAALPTTTACRLGLPAAPPPWAACRAPGGLVAQAVLPARPMRRQAEQGVHACAAQAGACSRAPTRRRGASCPSLWAAARG